MLAVMPMILVDCDCSGTKPGKQTDGAQSSDGNQDPCPAGYQLAWSDEFEGTAGSGVDPAKWVFDTGNGDGGWGNGELEYYRDGTSNAALDGNGNLVITARQESYGGFQYTSARMKTQSLAEWTYGHIEARIRLPYGHGLWPAFWLLGNDISTNSWPACGEIDVAENIGSEPTKVHGVIHGPGYSGSSGPEGIYPLPQGERFADDYHLFAIDWDQDSIRWYVDGQPYSTKTPQDIGHNAWVFQHPFFILLNVAVGGQWPGKPDSSTVFPQTMMVDYVRVCQRGATRSDGGVAAAGDAPGGAVGCGVGGEPTFNYSPISGVPQAVNDLGCLIDQEQRDVVTPGGSESNPGFSAADQQNFDNSNRLAQIVDSVTSSVIFANGVAALKALPADTQNSILSSYQTPLYPTWAMLSVISAAGTTDAGYAVEQKIATALTNAVRAALAAGDGGIDATGGTPGAGGAGAGGSRGAGGTLGAGGVGAGGAGGGDSGAVGCGVGDQPVFNYSPISGVSQAVNDLGCLIDQEQRDVVTPGGSESNPGFSAADQQNFDNSNRLAQIVDSVTNSTIFAAGVAALEALSADTQTSVLRHFQTPLYPTWRMNGVISAAGTTDAGYAVEQEIATALTNAVRAALAAGDGSIAAAVDSPPAPADSGGIDVAVSLPLPGAGGAGAGGGSGVDGTRETGGAGGGDIDAAVDASPTLADGGGIDATVSSPLPGAGGAGGGGSGGMGGTAGAGSGAVGCGVGTQPSFTYSKIPGVPQSVNDLGCLIDQEQRDVVTPGGSEANPGFSAVDQQNFENSNRLSQIVDSVTNSTIFAAGVAALEALSADTQTSVLGHYQTPLYPTWQMNGMISAAGTTDAGYAVEQKIATALTNAVRAALAAGDGSIAGAVDASAD
jgi:beta-glucanase (GH16 family)